MKIILSSTGFASPVSAEKIEKELGRELSELKVLFIPSAIVLPTRRGKFFSMMKKAGFLRENIYVFDHNAPNEYEELDIDMIYVCGGNTFLLADRIKKSGFGKAIAKYIENGVVYVGASAGVHLVGKNIEHLLPFDENITGTDDFSSLGIVDGIYYCHYGKEREKYYNEAVREGKYNVGKLGNDDVEVICPVEYTFRIV